LKNVTN